MIVRAALPVVVVALALVAGCRRGENLPRIYGPIARSAAGDLRCDHIDQVLYVAPRVVQVRGCGRRQEYVVDAARRPMHGIQRVENVAAHDLVCDRGSLHVESPAPAVRVVDGCGRRGRYDLRCTSAECGWSMSAHSGAWAGSEIPVPSQFATAWDLPPTVSEAPIAAPEGYVDLLTVPVPAPPTTPSAPVTPPSP